MIDTHCHLDHKQFDADRAAVTEHAFSSGVSAILIPAIEPTRFQSVLDLAASHTHIFCGMGIHPHDAMSATGEHLARVEELSHHTKVRAIGEIGLDYHYDFAPRDVQQEVFRQQVRIAKRRKLPIIVHNRESDDDVLRIVEEEQDGSLEGVFHCFSGTPAMAERAINLGMHVSFTGNITFKKSSIVETVASLPPDKWMIETDAPYMAPVPHRGKRNEPAFVRLVAEKIAEIRSCSLEEVLTMTTTTAQRLFRITLCTLVFALSTVIVIAQTTDNDNAETEELVYTNPYPKTFGFGVLVGTNTLVELFANGSNGSYDNALGFGGGASYYFNDYLNLNLAYGYYVNTAITRSINGIQRQQYPNLHQAIDLSLQYTANPSNFINFHFMLGASYLTNAFNAVPNSTNWEAGDIAIHGNIIGLAANIQTDIGLFYPSFEWRFNIALFQSRMKQVNPGDVRILNSYVFSIPRLTIYWFPTFGK
jgi:TatD DNase family protein